MGDIDPAMTASFGERLDRVLAIPELRALTAMYFAPSDEAFAGEFFNTLGDNPAERFVAADLLALNLLNEQLDARAIVPTLSGVVDRLLDVEALPVDIDLWDAGSDVHQAVAKLRHAVYSLPSAGPTRTAKLLARKRPRLCPIWDGVVSPFFSGGNDPWRASLGAALAAPCRTGPAVGIARHKAFEALRPEGVVHAVPTLRLLDVALWMLGSNSRAAQRARDQVGLTTAPMLRSLI